MWQNYLTVGIRSLLKQRTYALINIAGLAIGLAACILILLYVRYEQSYDKWMPDADRVFQLQTHYQATESGGEEMRLQMSEIVAGRSLVKDYPRSRICAWRTTTCSRSSTCPSCAAVRPPRCRTRIRSP